MAEGFQIMYLILKSLKIKLLYIIIAYSLLSVTHADELTSYCSHYAEAALESASLNIKHNCGFSGSRWLHEDIHYKWCLNSAISVSQKETEERSKLIKKCALSSKYKSYTINDKKKEFEYSKHNISKYSPAYYLPYIGTRIDLSSIIKGSDACSNKLVSIDYANKTLIVKLFHNYNSLDYYDPARYRFVCDNSYSDTEYNYIFTFKKKDNKYCLTSANYEYSTNNAYFEGILENESKIFDFLTNKVKVTSSTSYDELPATIYTKPIRSHECIGINDGLKMDLSNNDMLVM